VRDKFRIDELYDILVVRPLAGLAALSARILDPRVIDGAASGLAILVASTAGVWRRVQTGNVQHYALSFLVGALVLLGWYAAR
jgi:NADH-quinone oxidoreductase subunit L